MDNLCNMYPFQIMKTVRVGLNVTESILDDPEWVYNKFTKNDFEVINWSNYLNMGNIDNYKRNTLSLLIGYGITEAQCHEFKCQSYNLLILLISS